MAGRNKRNLKTKSPKGLNSIQWAGITVIVIIIAVACSYAAGLLPKQTSSAQTSGVAAVPTVKTMQWSSAPTMTIDVTKQYFATVKMAKGSQFVI